MSRKRILKLLIAGGFVGLIAVAGTGVFIVRDLLVGSLVFCVFVAWAALFGLRQPAPSVAVLPAHAGNRARVTSTLSGRVAVAIFSNQKEERSQHEIRQP